jgi:L,D-transpeptidase catalytic domain
VEEKQKSILLQNLCMKKWMLFLLLLVSCILVLEFLPATIKTNTPLHAPILPSTNPTPNEFIKLKLKAAALKKFALANNYATTTCFLIDMSITNGKKRFFVYDFIKDTVIGSGLVAHGSCNTSYQKNIQFSNTPDCGCSAQGKYKIGYAYNGSFGLAYKLYGLDSSNNNSFERFIVLHSHSCVPNNEVYPQNICNSLGCPTVSPNFLLLLKAEIESNKKPILLWMFD